MIRRHYRPDGVAELTAWVFECDGCHTIASVGHVRNWRLPGAAFRRDDTTTPIYCRDCARNLTQAQLFHLPSRQRGNR
ncbi:hypothetical protein [Actinomadura rupiterrae]|uniref:hypothetical protein n=1 Tax=Actinomadura rupiterrae TaxID=559627 RepID=UPI0020A4A42C|nr:hypothetical protein [Actinomadura rupiterrae]MCP2341022.1 hypothetical protein [Actinomadura rupiterrae]